MTKPTDRQRLSRTDRRDFLRLAGSGALLTLLGGCQPDPDATPTPTRTPRPTAINTPTGTPSPTAALPPPTVATPFVSPLGTPEGIIPTRTPAPATTPTPSLTPEPTATPTPTATPFPPGPPTKLGLFIGRNAPDIRDMLSTGNVTVIKTLEYDPNFAEELKHRAPNALLIGRMTLPQLDMNNVPDAVSAARDIAAQLLAVATEPKRMAAFDAWEAFNEPVVADAGQMDWLAQFEAERVRVLAAAGVRSVIGNFATGNPPLEFWPHFRPAIEAAIQHNGYLGLHEYSAPTMQFGTDLYPLSWRADASLEGWLTLRYRKVYRQYLEPNGLVLPLLLTEVGIDGAVADRPGPQGMGWKDFVGFWDELGMGKDAPGNYVEQLAWYDANLQMDKYVLGAAVFAAAAPPGWDTFEILGPVEPFLRQYLSVHPVR